MLILVGMGFITAPQFASAFSNTVANIFNRRKPVDFTQETNVSTETDIEPTEGDEKEDK